MGRSSSGMQRSIAENRRSVTEALLGRPPSGGVDSASRRCVHELMTLKCSRLTAALLGAVLLSAGCQGRHQDGSNVTVVVLSGGSMSAPPSAIMSRALGVLRCSSWTPSQVNYAGIFYETHLSVAKRDSATVLQRLRRLQGVSELRLLPAGAFGKPVVSGYERSLRC
jgi:hypothetical protein